MNKQAKAPFNFTEVAPDEQCLWCDADRSHLSYVGTSDEWVNGMRCNMIHCDACDNEFGVSCDIILDDDTLLHDHDETFQQAWWDSQQQPAPTQAWFD